MPTPSELVETYARKFFEDNEDECFCEISCYRPFTEPFMDGLHFMTGGNGSAVVHMDRFNRNPGAVIHASCEGISWVGTRLLKLLGSENSLENYTFSVKDGAWTITRATCNTTSFYDWTIAKVEKMVANGERRRSFVFPGDLTWASMTVHKQIHCTCIVDNEVTIEICDVRGAEPDYFGQLQAHSKPAPAKPEPEPPSVWDWVISKVEKMIRNCQVEQVVHVPENLRVKLIRVKLISQTLPHHGQIELRHAAGQCVMIKICKGSCGAEPDYYGQLLQVYRKRMTSTEMHAGYDLMDCFIKCGSFSYGKYQRTTGLTPLRRAVLQEEYGVTIGCSPDVPVVNIKAVPGGKAYQMIIDHARERIEQRDVAFIRMMCTTVIDAVAEQTISDARDELPA